MSLRDKSIHELRSIAQGYGVDVGFDMDAVQIVQAIELKQGSMTPDVSFGAYKAPYDGRLFSEAPLVSFDEAKSVLGEHIALGLDFQPEDPDCWVMRYNDRIDSGTLHMAMRTLVAKADAILKG